MNTEANTLGDALPLEIERVRELIDQYKACGPGGQFGVVMMTRDIEAAEKATREGDTIGMLRAYTQLQSWNQ
jgi:hypothetical protein